jgi:transposase, IS30 family
MHRHINKQDRACIAQLLRKHYSYSAIARVLDLSPSTISREVRRNRAAGRQARARRHNAKTEYRLIEINPNLEKTVQVQLKEKWSPEQIEHRTQLVSDSSIYRYLERHAVLKQYLRRSGRRRRRYGTKRIPSRYQANKRSIHERPAITSIGNWEGDTILGAERKLRIVTYVDKLSGYLVAAKLKGTADKIHIHAKHSFKNLPCQSIT